MVDGMKHFNGFSEASSTTLEHETTKSQTTSSNPSAPSESTLAYVSNSAQPDPDAFKRPVDTRENVKHDSGGQHVVKPSRVPRPQRRGIFSALVLVPEVEDPKQYGSATKWLLTFVVGTCAMMGTLGSGIIYPCLGQITEDLKTTAAVTNLCIAFYMLSMSIFPLWWSAASETFGRRNIYLISFALNVVFNVVSALSSSVGMLIASRILVGGASASVQAVGAGSIADIWEPQKRGQAMSIFYLGTLCGPVIAPIIGGALAQKWDWRAPMWFLVIFGGVTFILVLFALPETLKSRRPPPISSDVELALKKTSTRQSAKASTVKWMKLFKVLVIDPPKIVLYLRFMPIALLVYYASITFACLFVLNISIQDKFESAPYNFSTLMVGLLYTPAGLGYISASMFGGKWMDYIMVREAKKANRFAEDGSLKYLPEDRMRENAWLGAILYPLSLILYGWTVQTNQFWFVPMIGSFLFGVGSLLIFTMVTTMLTEFMPQKSSSGVAVNNFVRNIFSCVGSIVAAPLINAIGNGWIFTILGIIALASSLVVWAMKRHGPKWRITMDEKLRT